MVVVVVADLVLERSVVRSLVTPILWGIVLVSVKDAC